MILSEHCKKTATFQCFDI